MNLDYVDVLYLEDGNGCWLALTRTNKQADLD